MFKEDYDLIINALKKYGTRDPIVDIGGLSITDYADYSTTIRTGDQNARYVHFDWPFSLEICHDSFELAKSNPWHYGTVICCNVIEHVENPFLFMDSLYQISKDDCLVILSTVFSFPYHPSPLDYWRFSAPCLEYLCKQSKFSLIESGYHLIISADKGVLNTQNGEPQEVRACYIIMDKRMMKDDYT